MNRKIAIISALAVVPALIVLAVAATFGAVVITFRALDVATEAKRAVLEKDADAIIKNIDERERDVHAAINEQAARYTELEMLMRAAAERAPEPAAEPERERPEDRRTWANAETPIPQERLDAFLDKPEPVIPY